MKIRHATRNDLDGIFEILNQEIVGGVNAWDVVPVEGERRNLWFERHSDPRYPLLVAEVATGIAGWARLSRWAPHDAYERTAELSVFVHMGHRGRGVGSSLLSHLIADARRQGHHVLIARTEASNEASRRLHLGSGFRSVGVMHEVGYKFGRFLDAELFELPLEPGR